LFVFFPTNKKHPSTIAIYILYYNECNFQEKKPVKRKIFLFFSDFSRFKPLYTKKIRCKRKFGLLAPIKIQSWLVKKIFY